jgi:benzoate membrane transport protein
MLLQCLIQSALPAKYGLSEKEMVSWLFAGYGIGGIITVLLSVFYRQPISAAWSLPAAAIMGASLQHLTFHQVIGAYLAKYKDGIDKILDMMLNKK